MFGLPKTENIVSFEKAKLEKICTFILDNSLSNQKFDAHIYNCEEGKLQLVVNGINYDGELVGLYPNQLEQIANKLNSEFTEYSFSVTSNADTTDEGVSYSILVTKLTGCKR